MDGRVKRDEAIRMALDEYNRGMDRIRSEAFKRECLCRDREMGIDEFIEFLNNRDIING